MIDTPIPQGGVLHEDARWQIKFEIDKFEGDWTPEQIAAGEAPAPYEHWEHEGNMLLYGGVSCLLQSLLGNGTATPAQTLTYFDNTNAKIGVGDSNTAAAATQTDLQASTNKLRKAMDATYPLHTDGVVVGSASIVFRSTFASGDANYAWEEAGIFNGASGGRMLNRKVQSMGTKASGTSWQLTITITIT